MLVVALLEKRWVILSEKIQFSYQLEAFIGKNYTDNAYNILQKVQRMLN